MVEKRNVAGIEMAYGVEGDGNPVMLITGLAGVGRGWGDVPGRFATEFTTIVPDHPGTGGSGKPPSLTLDHHAEAMAELIRSLGCGPTHIVGSSTGGAIALLMALDHPDVVRSIVPVSSWARSDDHFRHQFAVRKDVLQTRGAAAYAETTALFLFSPTFFRDHYDMVRAWCDSAAGGSPEVMSDRIDMILRHDVVDRLADIAVPTMVLVGSHDACTPPHLSEELAAAIPAARLQVMEGGHLIYKEEPEGFHRVVRDFLMEA